MSANSAKPHAAPKRRVSRTMPVQPPVKVAVPLPRVLKASPQRGASDSLAGLRKELREAGAYWTRQYRWVSEVKRMTAEQVMDTWPVAEEWQLRSLAIQALEIDPTLRLELALYRETSGKGADGEYHAPSATLTQVLAAMVAKHPVRHPCVISRDIANARNGRSI
jgi:hypothetical protein